MSKLIGSFGARVLLSINVLLSSFLFLSTARATTYYVATNGVDSNNGTSLGTPFRTFAVAVTHLSAGDTLYIRGGVYREMLRPITSGTSVSPIVISAYQNEDVTLTGADVLTNAWTLTNSPSLMSTHIYVSSVATDLGAGRNQVFVGGEMMYQARFPNFGTNDLVHPTFSIVNVNTNITNIITSSDWTVFPTNSLVGAYIILSAGGGSLGYGYRTAPITASTNSTIVVDQRAFVGSDWWVGGGFGYIYGLLNLLDTNKEWHLDTAAQQLFLQTPNGDSPANYLVEMKTRNFTVSVSNLNYITVEGLKLRAGGALMQGMGLVFRDNDCRYLSHYQLFPYVQLPGTPGDGDDGLKVVGTNCLVRGCSVYDTCSSGIFLNGASNSVTRNFIYNIDYLGVEGFTGSAGIHIDGFNESLTFNTISNTGWAGISPNHVPTQYGQTIMYNDVAKCVELCRDSGGFYCGLGNDNGITRIAYNWFHDLQPFRHSAVPIYLDGTAINYLVDHNVGYNEIGRESYRVPFTSTSNKGYNNTFFNANPPALIPEGLNVASNNLYLAWSPETQLQDWRNNDFRLVPGSPSINAGVVIPGVTDGYTGSAPDLGAYNFGGPYWVPGINGWSVDQPGVETDPPVSWSSYAAIAAGTLISSGTSTSTVYVVWGTTDAGTNLASWSSITNLGTYTNNPISFAITLTNLTPSSTYYYRFYATNSSGVSWGMAQSFLAGGGIWAWEGNSLWSVASHWRNNNIADGANNMADLATLNISANRTNTLDSNRTIGALRFGDVGPSFDWILNGTTTLTMSMAGSSIIPYIDVTNRSAYIQLVLAGTEGLEKRGPGRMLLYSNNTYTGQTVVSQGALMVDGSIGGSRVWVKKSATLGGNGTIKISDVTVDATGAVSPGETGIVSIATLTMSNLWLNGSSLIFDLAGKTNAGGGINDLISLSGGVLNVSNSLIMPTSVYVNPTDGFLTNQTYTLISGASKIIGDVTVGLRAVNLPGVTFSTNTGSGPYNVYMTVPSVIGRSLVWRANSVTTWNMTNSPNWSNSVSFAAAAFTNGDSVRFDDNTFVHSSTLVGSLAPSSVVVENETSYTFGGSGKITGATALTKRGSAALTVTTANDYTGTTTIEKGNLIVNTLNALSTNSVLWLGTDASNNPTSGMLTVSGSSQTVAALNVVSINPAARISTNANYYDDSDGTNIINISSGKTFTVNGNITVGNSLKPGALTSFLAVTGAGTFAVNAPGSTLQIDVNSTGSSGNTVTATMDMSGLTTANINLGTNGSVNIGALSGGGSPTVSTLMLASNTTVTASTLKLGSSSGTNPKILLLGSGTNRLNIDNISLGLSRDYGQVSFRTNTGSLIVRGSDGIGRGLIVVGASSGTTYGVNNQFMDLREHAIDLLLNKLTVGEDSRGISGVPYSSNYFGMSTGTVDTVELRIGIRPGTPAAGALWFNTVDFLGGSVVVGTNGLNMGIARGTGAAGTQTTVLNVGGGSLTVNSNICMLTQLSTSFNDNSTINLTGGSAFVHGNLFCSNSVAGPGPRKATLNLNSPASVLDMFGFAIGGTNLTDTTASHFIDVLNFQAGTLKNVGEINAGAGLTKISSGTLTLAGTNTYSGNTVVSGGTLVVSPGPQPNSTFIVNDGALLKVSVANNTLTAAWPGLTLGNSGLSTVQFDFTTSPSTTIAPVTATNLTTQGGSQMSIIHVTGSLSVGQYPLFKYAGSIGGAGFGGFELGTLPAGVSASLVNNTANKTVDIQVLSVSTNVITWKGSASSVWDVETTANWLKAGSASLFYSGDSVRFDDSASTAAVILNGLATPGGVTISNITKTYTISGTGSIAGNGALLKQGSGTATLTTANAYIGASTVQAGKLVVSTAQQGGGSFSVSDGATLGVVITGSGTMPMSALTLGTSSGATLEFDLSGLLSTSTAPIAAGALTVNGVTTVNLNSSRPPIGQYPLIKYSGSLGGSGSFTMGTLPAGVTATIVNNTGNHSIDVSVTAVTQTSLKWSGNLSSAWDVGVTANWLNGASSTTYADQNPVLFDDTASTLGVTLNTNVYPAALTVSNVTKNYSFSGSGVVGGAASLTKVGASTLTLNNSASFSYTGGTMIKEGEVVIGANNAMPVQTTTSLGDVATAGKLTLSAADQTFGPLNIVGQTGINLITIGTGHTLNVNGSVVAAPPVTTSAFANNSTFTGAGTFAMQGASFQVGANNTANVTGSARIVMDMSALATATINVGSSGSVFLGDQATSGNGDLSATFLLASNTTVTAKTFQIGAGQRTRPQTLKLGSGATVLNVGTFTTDGIRDFGLINFATNTGTLKVRGASGGSSRAALQFAASSGTASAAAQYLDLRGHSADLLLSTLKVGEEGRGAGGAPGYSSNYFGFDTGTIDTTELRVGNRSPKNNGGYWVNICDLLGGTVTVGSSGITMGIGDFTTAANSTNRSFLNISNTTMTVGGNFQMLAQSAPTGSSLCYSTVSITNSSVTVNGNIYCFVPIFNPAFRQATLTLDGAASLLDLTGHSIGLENGDTNSYVDVLNFRAGTVQNVDEINGGQPLVKTGAGQLTLAGVNNYTGGTLVSNGIVCVAGSLNGGGAVTVTANTFLTGNGHAGDVAAQGFGTVSPGLDGQGDPDTLTTGDLTLNANSTLLFDLANVTTPGGQVNDLIDMHGNVLTVTGKILVRPNLLNGSLAIGTYTIISNATAIVGDLTNLFTTTRGALFSTNTGAGPYNVYLTIGSGGLTGGNIVWSGTNSNPNWDVSTVNWSNSVTHAADTYHHQDFVTFNDYGASGSVTLPEPEFPSAITVSNSTVDYTFSGVGYIGGAGSLTKAGTGSLTLNNSAANTYTGTTALKNGSIIAAAAGVLSGTPLTLGDSNAPTAGTLTINANQSVGELWSVSTNATSTNLLNIASGQTLTVNGNFLAGNVAVTSVIVNDITKATGGGTLVVNTNGGVFQLNCNTNIGFANGTRTMVNFSELAAANVDLGSSGGFYVGERFGGNGASGGVGATLLLASNSTVTAGTVSIGNSTGVNVETMLFGSGNNVFNVDGFYLGTNRDFGQVSFNSASGTFTLRASDGAGRSALLIGQGVGTSFAATNQFLNLGTHSADLLLNTLKVGEESRGGTSTVASSNYFAFGAGMLDTTEFKIGNRPGNPSVAQSVWYNTVNLSGGTVNIGAGGLLMCTNRGTGTVGGSNVVALNISGGIITISNDVKMLTQLSTSYVASATISITGGTNTVFGNITCGDNVATPGTRIATLTLNGSSAVLDLSGHVIGGTNTTDSAAAHHIDVLNLQAGTLLNVAQINSGATFTKTGSGTLTLGGTNNYSGATTISQGTLTVAGTNYGTGAFTVSSGATLNGTGCLKAAVTINSGGALNIGGTTGTPGTLTVSNTLTLHGTTTLRINKGGSPSCDLITGISTVTYGGTLAITNVGGTLANGDQFKLFNAATYSGSFPTLSLPHLTTGLFWDTNALATSGTIQVSDTFHGLALAQPIVQARTATLAGKGGPANGTYYVLTSTNLFAPANQWTIISTNTFGPDGSYNLNQPIVEGEAQRFYSIRPAN